ncbi:hypothetical protein PIB30_034541 [Stylosanthes scabra]|uniref:Myb/SANT-like DNA-binding domain-containing protein n=1 Tax=Stylosanthes scabra TaxID=79078 RepID=A0ABU6SCJ6_9FABA|nr:hypothetical protein [Stylosanthes scabra]
MDGTEDDDARYPSNPYGVNHQGYGYLGQRRLPVRTSPYPQPVASDFVEHNDNEEEEDEEDEDEVQIIEEEHDDDDVDSQRNAVPDNAEEGDDEDRDGDEIGGNNDDVGAEEEDEDEEDDEGDAKPRVYSMKDDDDIEWHPKKRKLKSLISAYEFAPRVPAPSAAAPSTPKPSSGGRNSLTDWTECETFLLLDAWGDKFLQHGRKSLRSEEWQEVAEKVSEVSKIERKDAQCRNRLDTLKKKYKKEKAKLEKMGGGTCKWVYFQRMDKLMSTPVQQSGLSCGLDSGEYVFTNPRVYLNRANGLDQMRDSPGNSESIGEEGSSGHKYKKRRYARTGWMDLQLCSMPV